MSQPEPQQTRIHFLDNLRSFTIFLVILYHSGGVYESSGLWSSFWIVDDPATNDLVGILNVIIDIFIMSLMFFIAGYATPPAMAGKSPAQFIKTRLKRLMLPWLVAALTLVPLYKVIFLYSRNLPQQDWTSYFHFSQGAITGQGWLWFLPLLFLFNMLYLGLSRIRLLPTGLALTPMMALIFVAIFASSLGMSMSGITGWTHSILLDFQNDRLLIYLALFWLGSECFHQNLFARAPQGNTLYILVNILISVPVIAYVVFLIFPLISTADHLISPLADKTMLWLSFTLSLAGLLYLMLAMFRRHFNGAGWLWTIQRRNSYYVYIVHVIVLGVIATLLLNAPLHSLLKYVILAFGTYLISKLIAAVLRKITGQ